MSEQTYNKVFELIRGTLVPKSQLDEAQIKIKHLESMLEKAKSESNEQKLSMEIKQAEKDSLQAEKESLQAEKKAIEVKFKEVTLKLKQKTNQIDSLLKSQADHEQNNIKKSTVVTSGTQTLMEEHEGVGIVSVPASLSSSSKESATQMATPGTKRRNVPKENAPKVKAKRKKAGKSNTVPRNTRQSSQSKPVFTCEDCLHDWGSDIEWNFAENPDAYDAPDPKEKIQTFTSLEDYKEHLCSAHGGDDDELTREFSYPNRDFLCKICNSSFKNKDILDNHQECEHLDPNMSNQQFYEVYQKVRF